MTKTVKLHLDIASTTEEVFRALTTQEDLRNWFAEFAEVSLEENRFAFWGKYTIENLNRDEGTHTILNCVHAKRISFEWKVRGTDSVVDIELESADGKCILNLTQSNVRENRHGEAGFADFWSLSLENLRLWIETGRAGKRCDHSLKPMDTVKASININKPRDEVFDALITPKLLDRYFTEGSSVDPVKGGNISFGWEFGGPIKILEIDRAERLSYSWQIGEEPETVVTWELEESGGGTRLMLVHSGFGEAREVSDYNSGWHDYLIRIKAMLEKGESWKAPVYESVDWYVH